VLQTPAAQTEQTRPADAAKNAQTDAARRLAGTAGDVLEIEETDAETAVHADSEGGGSQGRHDAPPEEAGQPSEDQSGIVVDDQGVPHLDVSA
jgi:hypothetical protein